MILIRIVEIACTEALGFRFLVLRSELPCRDNLGFFLLFRTTHRNGYVLFLIIFLTRNYLVSYGLACVCHDRGLFLSTGLAGGLGSLAQLIQLFLQAATPFKKKKNHLIQLKSTILNYLEDFSFSFF